MKEYSNNKLPKDVSWDDGYAVYLLMVPDDNLPGVQEIYSKMHNYI